MVNPQVAPLNPLLSLLSSFYSPLLPSHSMFLFLRTGSLSVIQAISSDRDRERKTYTIPETPLPFSTWVSNCEVTFLWFLFLHQYYFKMYSLSRWKNKYSRKEGNWHCLESEIQRPFKTSRIWLIFQLIFSSFANFISSNYLWLPLRPLSSLGSSLPMLQEIMLSHSCVFLGYVVTSFHHVRKPLPLHTSQKWFTLDSLWLMVFSPVKTHLPPCPSQTWLISPFLGPQLHVIVGKMTFNWSLKPTVFPLLNRVQENSYLLHFVF